MIGADENSSPQPDELGNFAPKFPWAAAHCRDGVHTVFTVRNSPNGKSLSGITVQYSFQHL